MLFHNSRTFNKFLVAAISLNAIVWVIGSIAKLASNKSFFLNNLESTATTITAATIIICSGYLITELILDKMHKNRALKINKKEA